MKYGNTFGGHRGSTDHLHHLVAYVIPFGGEIESTCLESHMEFTQLERGYGQNNKRR